MIIKQTNTNVSRNIIKNTSYREKMQVRTETNQKLLTNILRRCLVNAMYSFLMLCYFNK